MHIAGRLLILSGLAIALVGLILHLGWGKIVFGWIGHLPGDFRIEKENFRLFLPVTTAIILSIVFSLILRLAIILHD
ncbi:MAG TPA: DUF2905 domain-containing protein [Firmicutes bacterium]|nr:DUF2905 domain-containing protein [Bacillota bacterium]